MQLLFAPAKTSAPPATVWQLLDEADAVFLGSTVRVNPADAERLNGAFRQIRGYPAFRLLLRK
jgi:hypothetical protein